MATLELDGTLIAEKDNNNKIISHVDQLSEATSGGGIQFNSATILQKSASDPANPVEGQIYYNTTDNAVLIYNGTSWNTLSNVPAIDGGTVSTFGNYKLHAFTTSSSTLTVVNGPVTVDALIVAGGGGGGLQGRTELPGAWAGGGGAGGLIWQTGITLNTGSYTVIVGGPGSVGGQGGPSSFNGTSAIGGGRGGYGDQSSNNLSNADGGSGGSGGGGLGDASPARSGGSNTAGQGNVGGPGTDPGGDPYYEQGGGGGGAGEAGNTDGIGFGGDGIDMSSYIGTAYGESGWFAGGGAGGCGTDNSGSTNAGGQGGGGSSTGGYLSTLTTYAGLPNTGGGGANLQQGGSGIVIIRYPI
jgi:hypothetical protein